MNNKQGSNSVQATVQNSIQNQQMFYDDEINLAELFKTLWDGKWKILLTALLFMLSTFIFIKISKQPFEATTSIKPLNSTDMREYQSSNDFGFFEVDSNLLLRLFIEKITDKKILKEVVQSNQLIDKNEYKDAELYEKAVNDFIQSIKIIEPSNINGKTKGEIQKYWTINAEYWDEDKWRNLLEDTYKNINLDIKNEIQLRFDKKIEIVKKSNEFKIRDLDMEIKNKLNDYDRIVKERVAFLNEQGVIARKLGITKNTIETQSFSSQNAFITNIKSDFPFYLRGYEAIEQEIELIQNRKDKTEFIAGLMELENKKRDILQDLTIERAINLFKTTPIQSSSFNAVKTFSYETNFKFKYKVPLMLFISLIIGVIFGIFYVLIANSIRKNELEK